MQIVREIPLRHFRFWGTAARYARLLSDDELDELEEAIETFGAREDPYTATEINDFMRDKFDLVCELIDLDVDEVLERNMPRE